MPSLVVLGSSGFLGSELLRQAKGSGPVKAVARRHSGTAETTGLSRISADLLDASSLAPAIERGDVVINLAYMPDATPAENLRLIENVVTACVKSGARRLVHCSTAVVAGRTDAMVIDETVECVPGTEYEATKLTVEKRVLASGPAGLDVGILRPTAIIGAGGKNLKKLADNITRGSAAKNFLRASLFGRRKMHLVPVSDVARALLHLAKLAAPLDGNIYIAAADDDPDNNFIAVEQILSRALRGAAPRARGVFLPPFVLGWALKAIGKSDVHPLRTYSDRKLRSTGFIPTDTVSNAVREFSRSYLSDAN